MSKQLPLALQLHEETTFDNFFIGDNQQLVTNLKQAVCNQSEKHLVIYGSEGLGKTHLLQACCHYAQAHNQSAFYLPLTNALLSPKILDSLEMLNVVCLDDLQTIVGNWDWEEALFYCYNRLLANNTCLVIAANTPLKNLIFKIPDLASRLSACVIYQLQPLTDSEKIMALQSRAHARGLELSIEVGQYLLRHCPRDMNALFNLLIKLDQASLSAQRKLTVPFVKQVLDSK